MRDKNFQSFDTTANKWKIGPLRQGAEQNIAIMAHMTAIPVIVSSQN